METAVQVRRLEAGDGPVAKRLFAAMALAFGEQAEELGDGHVDALLADRRFWALAAFVGDEVVGGVTAHAIPMTLKPTSALFVYDVAVREDYRRRGAARKLISALETEAARLAIDEIFVLADDEDAHALAFYRALGGAPSAVTMFDLGGSR
jgi:aminoglycoside 3-N-acetyltransferase I